MRKIKYFLILFFLFYPAIPYTYCEIQRFDFIPEQSRITFFMQSTLHDFDGIAKEFDGFAEGDIEHIAETGKGSLKIKVKSMTTNHQKRDEYMMGDMEEGKYFFITFFLKSAKPSYVSEDKSKARLEITGDLEIHGTKKEVGIPVDVMTVDGRIHIIGQKEISLKDFKVKPTSFLFLRVKDKMVIKFDIAGMKNDVLRNVEANKKGN